MKVWIGYSPDEALAWDVARQSLQRHASVSVDIGQLWDRPLITSGLYKRPTVYRNGRLWDLISQAPMSTNHAIARFYLPLVEKSGWVLFTDGDVLFRRDVKELFALADPSKAIMVVKHDYHQMPGYKKHGDIQLQYPRKNWSSVMLWNLDHPAHQALTLEILNSVPGRDLHRFYWLDDSLIGELPPEWNWLVGHSAPHTDPAIVHYTEGLPDIVGHEDDPFADEWRSYARSHPVYESMFRKVEYV